LKICSTIILRVFSDQELLEVTELEAKREKFLRDRETNWQMKSIFVWLELGDENTKCFHRFSNHRKSVNTI
jgi:hypothetical protein